MKFLYPEFLWAFAVLIIPILIHLFNFKRYKTLYFSSLNFVKHVDQQTKSTQKLKHLLVLLTRLLAFIFLVLAFARPYFSNGTAGETAKESTVFLFIDNSFSMQAQGVEGELLSEARESARALIEQSSQGMQFIIGTNELAGLEQRRLSKIEALEKIDAIDYSPLDRNINEIIDWKTQTLSKLDIDTSRLLQSVVLSDFQATALGESKKANIGNIHFHPVQFLPENTNNLYIDSVWFSAPIRRIGNKNELNIRVVNHSEEDLQNVEITVGIDQFQKTFYTDIPANQKKVSTISYTDKSIGLKEGSITVADDFVHFDDTYHLSYEVKNSANILLISAEDQIPNIGVVLGLEDYYQVEQTDITAITLDDFKQKDIVFINGANALSTGVNNYLVNFYKEGGSLALFPGKSPNTAQWNDLLRQLSLPEIGPAVSSGTRIDELNFDDLFISGIVYSKTKKLNLPSVNKAFRPLIKSNSDYKTLFTLKNGLPLLVYSPQEADAYMFYSSLHPDWGSFSNDALFSTMLLRMGELSQRTQPISLTIGEQKNYPVYSKENTDGALTLSNGTLEFIPQTTIRSGISYISLNQLGNFESLTAGTYSIIDDQKIGNLSMNYSRSESKLAYFSENQIIDIFKTKGAKEVSFKAIDGIDTPLSGLKIDNPFSYWKICIVLTLIFVLLEMLLIRFYKK